MSNIESIEQKHLQDLDINELIQIHLSSQRAFNTKDFVVHSCLHTLERNLLHSRSNIHIYPFCALLCAFSILDQIGSVYEPINPTSETEAGNGIKKALHYFSNYDAGSIETKALVAFRNGIMHDGAFTNYSRFEEKHYIFRLNKNQHEVIKVAQVSWDGRKESLNENVFSYINADEFYALVFGVLSNIRSMFLAGEIKSNLNKEDFLHKFILWDTKENVEKSNIINL